MIQFKADGLVLSVAVVRALLEFAEDDKGERPYLQGIGIDDGDVCATDGHSAVRFEMVEVDGCVPSRFNGRLFGRAFVERELRAVGRSGLVTLPWVHLQADHVCFPKLSLAEPKAGVSPTGLPIGWDVKLLARVQLAARACRREREKGELTPPWDPPAVLTSLGEYLDAMTFTIGGEYWDTAVHRAYVTIMPMNLRARGATSDEATVREARRKVAKTEADKRAKAGRRRVSEARKQAKVAAVEVGS